MIDVVHDAQGVQMALEEIFEQDFVRSRIDRESAGTDERTRQRMYDQVPLRTLSPGYYQFASHLLYIEHEIKIGIQYSQLAAFEAAGLLAVDRARHAFENRHPPCGSCGARQQNRFMPACQTCGSKFRQGK